MSSRWMVVPALGVMAAGGCSNKCTPQTCANGDNYSICQDDGTNVYTFGEQECSCGSGQATSCQTCSSLATTHCNTPFSTSSGASSSGSSGSTQSSGGSSGSSGSTGGTSGTSGSIG